MEPGARRVKARVLVLEAMLLEEPLRRGVAPRLLQLPRQTLRQRLRILQAGEERRTNCCLTASAHLLL